MTCCPPSDRTASARKQTSFPAAGSDLSEVVELVGGKFLMGARERVMPEDGEYPARAVKIRPFKIDACAVTNIRFAKFISETGYITDAENYGWSFVFFSLLARPDAHERLAGLEWWRRVEGARWDRPEGPGSDVQDRMDHPVTQISWNDATAFASWAGGRLPTEAEWEFAAQAGQKQARYPWGDAEPDDTTFLPCNIWQGRFPHNNTSADGHIGTAPVRSYDPNPFGLYNMVGNTWEWNADAYRIRSLSKSAKLINAEATQTGGRVVKGGSFLCHKSYCYRYRIAARSFNTPDTTLSHTGFRLCYS